MSLSGQDLYGNLPAIMNTPSARLALSGGLSLLAVLGLTLLLAACAQERSDAANKAPPKRAAKPHLVEVDRVARETLGRKSVQTGTLRARRSLRVFSQEEGRITFLPHYEGDRVAQDAILMRLDEALLKAELSKAIATRHQAELDLKRLERLMRKKLVAEDELARAKTAVEVARAEETVLRTRLGYTVEKAPFAGVIEERLAEPGDVVSKYTHVLTLTDPGSLVTEFAVSELVLPQIKVGDAVEVRIDALGNQRFPGRILRIHPSLDVRTRQGMVEVTLTPVPAKATAGQFCRVTLSPSGTERLLIPFGALRRDQQGEFVFRLGQDTQVHRVPIRSGEKLADRVEVLEGLADGDRVVVRGFLGLRDGMKAKVVSGG